MRCFALFHAGAPATSEQGVAGGIVLELWSGVMIALVFLSLLVGISLGLLGGGGSILMVPVFTIVAGMETKAAIAASLFVVAVTSLTGAIGHARAGRVDVRVGVIFGAAGMVGAFVGGRLAALVPAQLLMFAFAAMMVATSIAMLRGRRGPDRPPGEFAPSKAILDGLIVGVVTGLVGAGGGFLVVPALVLFGGLSMERAIGTSLLVIALKSFAGVAGHLGHVAIDWQLVGAVTGVAVVGSFIGVALASRVSPATLRRGFGGFVLVMAIVVVARELLV